MLDEREEGLKMSRREGEKRGQIGRRHIFKKRKRN